MIGFIGATTVPKICRELGINAATFYTCLAKYGGVVSPMMARIKELEAKIYVLKRCI